MKIMNKLITVILLVFFITTVSFAADYPNKPITLINPWSAGGGTDVIARTLAEELKSILNVNVIVVNKTGGSGAVGIAAAAESAPDGYTLFINDKSFISSHYMGVTKIRWDDMQPVCGLDLASHGIVVHSDSPWQTPQGFIAEAKENPGEITIGVSGIGGMSHLNAENFKLASGADMKIVSFEGAAKSQAALAGQHIDAMSAQLGEIRSFIEAGEFRLLAVGDVERHPAFPDTPTFREVGVDFVLNQYRVIWAPEGTSIERVQVIADAVELAMNSESMEKLFKNTLTQNYFMGPEEVTAELERQDDILKKLVEDSGLLK
jgi:tripartite-type tricarboxylate transporter receptor subunit TctC